VSFVDGLPDLGYHFPSQIACRSTKQLDDSIKRKISMFCHVPPENVLAVHDCPSMYHVPILLESQGALKVIMSRLQMEPRHNPDTNGLFNKWKQLADRVERLHESVNIALVGKYTELQDSYISVVKSLEHASLSCNRKLNLLVGSFRSDLVMVRN
jgi:CTP synthase